MIFAGLLPIGLLGELVSIGDPARVRDRLRWRVGSRLHRSRPSPSLPDATRSFPTCPPSAIGACLFLMSSLPVDTWARLIIWMALGLLIYFLYGKKHSKVQMRGQAVARRGRRRGGWGLRAFAPSRLRAFAPTIPHALHPPPRSSGRGAGLAAVFVPGQRVCLTTHVNPDGDGLGSEAGLAHLLRAQGIDAVITNPTPTPPRFGFLFGDLPGVDRTREGGKGAAPGRPDRRARHLRSRPARHARRDGAARAGFRRLHGPPRERRGASGGPRYVDPEAAATGELIFEIALANDWPLTQAAARGLYVAMLTDTGGFRFSNTRPHTLRIAAELLEVGVDPEEIYLEVYARAPEGRPRLFAEALQTLVVEPEYGLAWVTVPPGSIERLGVSSDDLDGVVEFPRSIEGVRMALLFREITQGRVKVSLRSVGDVDVAAFAKPFGGGGHTKAAGLSLTRIAGEVQETVLTAAREYLGGNGESPRSSPRLTGFRGRPILPSDGSRN